MLSFSKHSMIFLVLYMGLILSLNQSYAHGIIIYNGGDMVETLHIHAHEKKTNQWKEVGHIIFYKRGPIRLNEDKYDKFRVSGYAGTKASGIMPVKSYTVVSKSCACYKNPVKMDTEYTCGATWHIFKFFITCSADRWQPTYCPVHC